jgi:hypothetical protein
MARNNTPRCWGSSLIYKNSREPLFANRLGTLLAVLTRMPASTLVAVYHSAASTDGCPDVKEEKYNAIFCPYAEKPSMQYLFRPARE